jgi:hypothetical protein
MLVMLLVILVSFALKRLRLRMQHFLTKVFKNMTGQTKRKRPPGSGEVIDAEYTEADKK